MPATEGQAGDAGVADDPTGGRQSERLALPVEVLIEAAAFDADGARQRIDTRPRS